MSATDAHARKLFIGRVVQQPMSAMCLWGAEPATVGGLCHDHASAIASCHDITHEQVRSNANGTPARRAFLIDQWGTTHALSPVTMVGRARAEIELLHHTVSALHAQLFERDGVWHVFDRGSLNGTYVNGARIRQRRLRSGDRVTFGGVSLYFRAQPTPFIEVESGPGWTVPPVLAREFRRTLTSAGRALVVSSSADGGSLAYGEASAVLTRLEFDLVRRLLERRLLSGADVPAFVSSDVLLRSLEFRSGEADHDNLRQLVRRVRAKLRDTLGLEDLISSRKGVGYQLAWNIADAQS